MTDVADNGDYIAGSDPEFTQEYAQVKEIRAAHPQADIFAFDGRQRLSPDELLELRLIGDDAKDPKRVNAPLVRVTGDIRIRDIRGKFSASAYFIRQPDGRYGKVVVINGKREVKAYFPEEIESISPRNVLVYLAKDPIGE